MMKIWTWKKILLGIATFLIITSAFFGWQLKKYYIPPVARLALEGSYPEMPADLNHVYLNHLIDHNNPTSGKFRGFYLLNPNFKKGDRVVFFLTDGQMELVNQHPDFSFFDRLLGGMSYVLIGARGHSPTLFPEVYQNGKIDLSIATKLYSSWQMVEDIEDVRKDMIAKNLLPENGQVSMFGASGAGVLLQQYLSKYGHNIDRAVLQVTGAPDLAKSCKIGFTRNFQEFSQVSAELFADVVNKHKIDSAELAYLLYQAARSSRDPVKSTDELLHKIADGGLPAFWQTSLKPQFNLKLARLMLSFPAADCIKVRWYELTRNDLLATEIAKNPMNDFSRIILSDYLDAESIGIIKAPNLEIHRDAFAGEVLIISGTEDIVFSPEMARIMKKAYRKTGLIFIQDGHRMLKSEAKIKKILQHFYESGLNSKVVLQAISEGEKLVINSQ